MRIVGEGRLEGGDMLEQGSVMIFYCLMMSRLLIDT